MSDDAALIRCNACLVMNRVPLTRLANRPLCGNCKKGLDIPREPVWAKAESFDLAIAGWPETVLVVFTAALCIHCKIIGPVINDLARDRAGKLKVMKVDVDTDEYLPQPFSITKTPTILVFRNGVELIRVDGPPKNKTDISQWVVNLINFKSY